MPKPKNRETTVIEDPMPPVEDGRALLTTQRDYLINELRPLLLTKRDLWRGGADVRTKAAQESSSYQPIIDEINKLGRQLDVGDLNFNSIRREG